MTHTPKIILVVDDVRDWQKTLTGLLSDEGYRVVAVGDRRSALEAVRTTPVDLAVIDVRLDETDEANTAGLNLAKEIKQVQAGLPIIIITGYETRDTVERAFERDETGESLAIDFVLKVDINQLIDSINHILRSTGL